MLCGALPLDFFAGKGKRRRWSSEPVPVAVLGQRRQGWLFMCLCVVTQGFPSGVGARGRAQHVL